MTTPSPQPPERMSVSLTDDARLARLEAHAERTIGGLRGVRAEIRELRTEMRELRTEMRALHRRVDQHLFLTLGAIAATWTSLVGMMAKGFHWF